MGAKEPLIGFIGLGAMGGGMVRNLLKEGFPLLGFDIRKEALAGLEEVGGEAAGSMEEVVERGDVVMSCLVSSSYIEVAQQVLIPQARQGQIFIDCSTLPPPDSRVLSGRLVEKGARPVEAPVSGGEGGAAKGMLRIFAGGKEETVEECMPYLRAIGNPEQIFYCGPTGMGQVGKALQQMKDRLLDAMRLEIFSYGLRAGLDFDQVLGILNVDPDDRSDGYARLHRRIAAGEGDELGCLITEWRYFLAESKAQGFRMPMLEGMYEFCQWGEQVCVDNVHRPGPSVWRELMKDNPHETGEKS